MNQRHYPLATDLALNAGGVTPNLSLRVGSAHFV
jgi:hypothetical protein